MGLITYIFDTWPNHGLPSGNVSEKTTIKAKGLEIIIPNFNLKVEILELTIFLVNFSL